MSGRGEAAVPPGWVEAPLGAVLAVGYGKALPQKQRRSGSVAVWSSAGLVGEHDDALIDGPVLVIGRKGAAGNVMVADGPLWVIDTAYFARVPPEFNLKFLAHQLQAANLRRLDQSTAVPSLSRDALYRVPLRFPGRAEQDRIVEELQRLLSLVEAGERSFVDARDGCVHLRTALLTQLAAPAFPRVNIGDIAQVFVGATPSRERPELWGGDVAWVSSGEVAFCRISDTSETITTAGLGNRFTRLHPPGSVLLAMIGEGKTRGQAAILDISAAHNQNCASIRLDPARMLPEFLYYCLMSQYEYNRQAASGSQQPALNGGLVRAIEVPCPSLQEQA